MSVIGAAPSGRAADELATATGIPSSTLHRLLIDAGRNGGLPRGCVLVVDEAGMAETRILAPLLHLVERAEGKAILVGDPSQLPAVGAGGLYAALCEQLGTLELTENRRQHDLTERHALARLRGGDPEPYLAHAAKRGRLSIDEDTTVAKQRLLEDWWQTASNDPIAAVMIAYRRADIRELNDAAHALMLRAGRLGEKACALGEREFRVGDRVLCRHNDLRLGLQNGTRATIVDLDPGTLTLCTDQGALRSAPLEYAGKFLDHGYALTGHAAQGATVDRAFVLVEDRGALHEWGYVACSRARNETRLYLATPPFEPDVSGHRPGREGAPERTARALERSNAEPLALDQMTPRPDIEARLHARRQDELQRQRDRASESLGTARSKLNQLGWWKRGDQRVKLEREAAFQELALRGLDKKVGELARTPQPRARQMPGLDRDHEHPTRSHRPEPPGQRVPQREPPSLGLER